MSDIRVECAKIVQKILEEKLFFGDLKKSFSSKDLPFANMLILTSLRYWSALNMVLKSFVSKKIPNKHRLVEYLLKLAITEIVYMNTAPYAVINQTVQNIKKNGDKFLGGLANAVLRKVVAEKEKILQDIANVILIPENFLPLLDGYSEQELKQISDSIKDTVPLDITVKDNPEVWSEKLGADVLPNGTLRIFNAAKIQSLPEYASGNWWVQDVAASLPVAVMGDVKGKKVVDLCAAPGGKTAQLASKGALVTALDISDKRLQTLQQNMQRLGFKSVKSAVYDAIEYVNGSAEKYDMVLLDAPCSASGTFRRHPEVLHIKNISDVNEQKKLQRTILDGCANILKKDGILVYSVCSICKEEGEVQVAEFLREHSEFKRIPISQDEISTFGKWSDKIVNENGDIRTLPYYLKSQKGMDAFFICKMKRII